MTDHVHGPPWYAIRPHAVLELAAVCMIALAALGTLVLRERIARLPEIGRAVPLDELRTAWAEADADDDAPTPPPVSPIPNAPHPENRP